jgi:hypothetical protein
MRAYARQLPAELAPDEAAHPPQGEEVIPVPVTTKHDGGASAHPVKRPLRQ